MLRRLKTYKNAPKEVERLAGELAASRKRTALWRERAEKAEAEPFDASSIVWIFGSGRSGTSWLASMLGEREGFEVWFEPRVGKVLDSAETNKGAYFVFAPNREDTWKDSLRMLVLKGAATRYPKAEYVVVKEPGTASTPALTRAVPDSRIIFLLRDPRDVVASWLDGAYGWRAKLVDVELAREDPQAFVEGMAISYMYSVGPAREAHRSHEGPKTLLRYEDLLSDTFGEMSRIYRELGIEVDEAELTQTVEKHSWNNIPEEKRGEGKFYRKATPGGWKEDLTPEQIATVEEICAPILEEFYPNE